MNIITNKNIRATALNEFWGDEYDESIYLWAGAKHNMTLDEIASVATPTMKDIFATTEQVNQAEEYCRSLYFKLLPVLAAKLNEMHGLSLSVASWAIIFGYWLFRHISIVFEKYSYLQKIDINRTSIKLLARDSFYIPNDHYDYLYCFCNDFGVQQLVSQYYYIFNKNRDYPYIIKTRKVPLIEPTVQDVRDVAIKPTVGLLNVVYTENVLIHLISESKEKIQWVMLPQVNISSSEGTISHEKRVKLLEIDIENDFESYLSQTLYYCLPRMFVEYFCDYYDTYLDDIKSKQYSYIVAETWISHIPSSIYAGAARNEGVKLISQEHAFAGPFINKSLHWLELENADFFLTTGWTDAHLNIIPGGFSCRDTVAYQFEIDKKDILFVSHVRFPYLMEFGGNSESNSNYLKSLTMVQDFISTLPEHLRCHFLLRPRRDVQFWDTEHAWDVERKNIPVDHGNYSESVLRAKIVIIDHISTGIAELFLMNVPCLIILDQNIFPLPERNRIYFDDLEACGVVHATAQSAVTKLSSIYDNVEGWWRSGPVKRSVDRLKKVFLGPPNKTTDFLLSLIAANPIKTPLSEFVRDTDGVYKSLNNNNACGCTDHSKQKNYIYSTLTASRDNSIFSEELRKSICDLPSKDHFSQERHNLLRHLQLTTDMKVLELGCRCGAITRQLGESGAGVTAIERSLEQARCAALRCRDLPNVKVSCAGFSDIIFDSQYDLITLIGVLDNSPLYFDSSEAIREFLGIIGKALKPDGVLVLAIENQLGLKYLSGSPEGRSGLPFFGIESRYNEKTSVAFGRKELENLLKGMGLSQVEFHYPFPDYKMAEAVFTEKAFQDNRFYPGEIIRQLPSREYSGEPAPVFDEKLALPVLCRNGLMEDLSNSFLVLASRDCIRLEGLRDGNLLAAHYTAGRSRAYNVETIFARSGEEIKVRKKRLAPACSTFSEKGVLIYRPREEKYIGGLNLEAEYRKYIKMKDINALSHLFTLQLDFLEQEAIACRHPHNPAMAEIHREFINCTPANLIIREGRLHYIGREWELHKPVSLGALLLRTVDALHDIDHDLYEISKENLIQVLGRAGYHISDDIVKEYSLLKTEIIAQDCQSTDLDNSAIALLQA